MMQQRLRQREQRGMCFRALASCVISCGAAVSFVLCRGACLCAVQKLILRCVHACFASCVLLLQVHLHPGGTTRTLGTRVQSREQGSEARSANALLARRRFWRVRVPRGPAPPFPCTRPLLLAGPRKD